MVQSSAPFGRMHIWQRPPSLSTNTLTRTVSRSTPRSLAARECFSLRRFSRQRSRLRWRCASLHFARWAGVRVGWVAGYLPLFAAYHSGWPSLYVLAFTTSQGLQMVTCPSRFPFDFVNSVSGFSTWQTRHAFTAFAPTLVYGGRKDDREIACCCLRPHHRRLAAGCGRLLRQVRRRLRSQDALA